MDTFESNPQAGWAPAEPAPTPPTPPTPTPTPTETSDAVENG